MITPELIISSIMMLVGLGSFAVSSFYNSRSHNRIERDSEIELKVSMERIASTTDSTQRDVREMKGSVERLDSKLDKHDNRIFGLEKERETMWRRIDGHDEVIKDIQEEIKEISHG